MASSQTWTRRRAGCPLILQVIRPPGAKRPEPRVPGPRKETDGRGGRGLGQGAEGAARRARAQAACTRRNRGAPGRGGDGGGVGAALSQAVEGAASLLPF